MKDLVVLVLAALFIGLAFFLTRKKPGAATHAVKPIPNPEAPAPEAAEPETEIVVEIKDVATHAAEVAALETEPGPALASAKFKLGVATARAGDVVRASALIAEAVSTPSTDKPTERARLGYVVTQADFLARAGKLADAEQVLRDHLPAREAAFGRLHAGYAAGLAPLARLVLARGDARSAAALAEEAAAVLSATRDANAPLAIGFATAARVAIGETHANAEKITNDEMPSFLAGLLDACDVLAPEPHSTSLVYGLDLLSRRGLLASPAGVRLLDRYGQVQRARGAFDEAERAWAKLAEVANAINDPDLATGALVGVAVMRTEMGNIDGAMAVFQQIETTLDQAPAERRANVRREHGLLLTRKDKDAALAMLDRAVQDGREAGAGEALGRALAAAGVWRHHAGDTELAVKLLEEALTVLPKGHPDHVAAEAHLEPARTRTPCECARRGQLEQELTTAVSKAIGEGVARVRMQPTPGGTNFGLEFSRQPTDAELEAARKAIEETLKGRMRPQASPATT